MRCSSLLALLALTLVPQASAQIGGSTEPSASNGTAAAANGTVLFSTFAGVNPTPFAITSQSFTDLAGFATQGADDFTITGDDWEIQTVQVQGAYFNGSGGATSLNIFILGDAAGLPDTTNLSTASIYAAENLSYSDVGFGDFLVDLPGDGVMLPAGTYWLVVQANMAIGMGGQWVWIESATAPGSGMTVGAESAWFQTSPGLIVPGNCIDSWGARVATCELTRDPPDPNPQRDLAFQLEGRVLVGGVNVSPISLTTAESGTMDSFDVVLDSQPTADVTMTLTSSNPNEGAVSLAMLTFTPGNWNIPQTVTVTGLDDDIDDGDVSYTIVTAPTLSMDPNYNDLNPADVAVSNQDDDTRGVTVTPTSGLVTTEDGVTASFTVVLESRPISSVFIPLVTSDLSEGSASLPTAGFGPNSWDVPITVTVTGRRDFIVDGDQPFTIRLDPVISPFTDYFGFDADDVSLTNLDRDVAEIQVSPSTGLVTTETGSVAEFFVELSSIPSADVIIDLASSDTGEGTITPAQLVFEALKRPDPKRINITGVDDATVDGDQAYEIVTKAAVSTDTNYADVDAGDVAVTNLDNDTAGISIDDVSITEGTGGDTTATFAVTLDAPVDGGFTVEYGSADGSATAPADYTAAMATLTFVGNAGEIQTIAINVIGDSIVEPEESYSVDLGSPSNQAVNLNVASAVGTIVDDDSAEQIPVLNPALSALLALFLAGIGNLAMRVRDRQHRDRRKLAS